MPVWSRQPFSRLGSTVPAKSGHHTETMPLYHPRIPPRLWMPPRAHYEMKAATNRVPMPCRAFTRLMATHHQTAHRVRQVDELLKSATMIPVLRTSDVFFPTSASYTSKFLIVANTKVGLGSLGRSPSALHGGSRDTISGHAPFFSVHIWSCFYFVVFLGVLFFAAFASAFGFFYERRE